MAADQNIKSKHWEISSKNAKLIKPKCENGIMDENKLTNDSTWSVADKIQIQLGEGNSKSMVK